MSRIIAGRAKGRRLAAPKGLDTRPTGGRVKQTLFDILAPELPGCRFLDAFAGAGGIGLEALSRGAAVVVLVDTSASAVGAIKENLRALGDLGGSAQVFRQDARVALPALAESGHRFDVVYLHPPYASDLYEPLLPEAGHLLVERGVVVAEHFHNRALPEAIGPFVPNRSVPAGDVRL